MSELRVKVLPVVQPIGTYYVGVLTSKDLIAVSAADVRRLKDSSLDSYMGIQRRLDPTRMREINSYVNSFDSTFPTAVILAVDDENAYFEPETGDLILYDNSQGLEDIATIIDGQHRIEGLKAFKGSTFDVPVCFFVGADKHLQATVFATVNLAQTKVNKSLAYDLLDYEKLDSPQKIAHWIAVSLDRMEVSPFRGRIKRLGVATEGRARETITQATVVEMLVHLFLSAEPVRDRNSLWSRPNRHDLTDDGAKFPFRRLYRRGRDEEILANLINYFNALKQKYPSSWEHTERRGNVLPKTNGFRALMRALREVYPKLSLKLEKDVLTTRDYFLFVDRIPLTDDEFTTENFPAGTSGEAGLFNRLKPAIDALA